MDKFTEAEKLEVLEHDWIMDQMNPEEEDRDWYACADDPYPENENGYFYQRGYDSDGNARIRYHKWGF